MDADFYLVPGSQIFSQWTGKGEKSVKALFTVARERSNATGRPVIIFMDEVDSIFAARDDDKGNSRGSRSNDRIMNEFLVEMDGCLANGKENILVLAATNRPWILEPAVYRRLDKKIYIPLPDGPARRKMFETKLNTMSHVLNRENFDELERNSEGYSGSDIRKVVKGAAFRPIKKFTGASHFKVDTEFYSSFH